MLIRTHGVLWTSRRLCEVCICISSQPKARVSLFQAEALQCHCFSGVLCCQTHVHSNRPHCPVCLAMPTGACLHRLFVFVFLSLFACAYRCVRNNRRARPCQFIGFGAMDVPKPYECIWLGDTHGPKPHEIIRSRAKIISHTQVAFVFWALIRNKVVRPRRQKVVGQWTCT